MTFIKRFEYLRDAISYGIETLELRKEKKRVDKALNELSALEKFQRTPRCEFLKGESTRINNMYQIYKEFSLKQAERFLSI